MWPFASYPEMSAQELKGEYDYIVIGGGTAGCTLANRLSSDPSTSVLLVERGFAHDTLVSRIPLFSNPFSPIPAPSFKQENIPEVPLGGRSQVLFNGYSLGGTSRINAMLYTRGLAAEYNAWSAAGRQGWSYDELLPLFKKSQRSLVKNPSPEAGVQGEWIVTDHDSIFFEHASVMFDAGKKLGLPYLSDVNSSSTLASGCSKCFFTANPNGSRESSFTAFLPASLVRARHSHLDVCTGSIATKLDIQSVNGSLQVFGVYLRPVSSEANSIHVVAKREVILSGGPLENPKLLQLSGVGPADHLQALGIPVLKDLPGVGAHLQDHVAVPTVYSNLMSDSIVKFEKQPTAFLKEAVKYFLFGTGILTCPVIDISVFANSTYLNSNQHLTATTEQQNSRAPKNLPDIEIMPSPTDPTGAVFDKNEGKFSTLSVLLRPQSVGSVRIRSSNPEDQPDIDLGTLSCPADWTVLRTAVRLSAAIVKEMKILGYKAKDYRVPADDSDAAIDEHIRKYARTTYHYSSTCRMAPEDDPKPGVVDDKLRVYGVKGLRVADSSIFPQIVATHLQAPTVMVAEKCAELIKAVW